MSKYAASFDWSRTFNTSDPTYYRWTQWLFLKFYERGLAYRKNSPVNWCPQDQTVLANEQVVGGMCERCGAEVTKKELTQWYFKITDYAQELLDGLDELEDTWPDRVVTAQRNWIGRSEGAHVTFTLHTAGGDRGRSWDRVCLARLESRFTWPRFANLFSRPSGGRNPWRRLHEYRDGCAHRGLRPRAVRPPGVSRQPFLERLGDIADHRPNGIQVAAGVARGGAFGRDRIRHPSNSADRRAGGRRHGVSTIRRR